MSSKSDLAEWNRIAKTYDSQVETGERCFSQVSERFWEILGEINGKSVIDLGCGQGWLTQELTERGATVTGVDGSSRLIEIARHKYPDCDFKIHDLTQGLPEQKIQHDLVVSNMVVMDLPEIDQLFCSVAEALRPDGLFIFTLPHPCFFMQKSHKDEAGKWFKKTTNYLSESVRRIESFGGHNHYHRPLSYYFNRLVSANLLVMDLYEPAHEAPDGDIDPQFQSEFPVFMMIAAIKKNNSGPAAGGDLNC